MELSSKILLEKFYWLSNNQKYEIIKLRRRVAELEHTFSYHPGYVGDEKPIKIFEKPPYYEQELKFIS